MGTSGTTATGTCASSSDSFWYNGRDGKVNSSGSFDGGSDYITIDDNSIYSGLRAVSVSAWIYPDEWSTTIGSYHFIVAKSNWGDNREFRIRYEHDPGASITQRIRWHISDDGDDPGANETDISAVEYLPVGSWYHVLGTYDSDDNSLNFFVNGELVDSATNVTSGLYDGTAPVSIGSSGDDGANETTQFDNFDGQIDEVKIWNYALTAEQVKNEYNGGSVKFSN